MVIVSRSHKMGASAFRSADDRSAGKPPPPSPTCFPQPAGGESHKRPGYRDSREGVFGRKRKAAGTRAMVLGPAWGEPWRPALDLTRAACDRGIGGPYMASPKRPAPACPISARGIHSGTKCPAQPLSALSQALPLAGWALDTQDPKMPANARETSGSCPHVVAPSPASGPALCSDHSLSERCE